MISEPPVFGETFQPLIELARHYLKEFFDGGQPGDGSARRRSAIKIISALIPVTVVLAPAFQHRYLCLQVSGLRGCPWYPDERAMRAAYLATLPADEAWLIGVAMALTAVAASVRWDLLFPRADDIQKLGSLPIPIAYHFVARLAAVCLGFIVFLAAFVPEAALPFAYFSSSPFSSSASVARVAAAVGLAMAAGATSVFFSCVSLQGLILTLAPPRWVREASGLAHGAVFVSSLCSLPFLWRQSPLAGYWPPGLFLRLADTICGAESGSLAPVFAAVTLPLVASMTIYFTGSSQYGRLAEARRSTPRRRVGRLSRLADLCFSEPAECAVAEFACKALLRSWRLRRIFLASCAAAIVWSAALLAEALQPEGFPIVLRPATAALAAVCAVTFGLHRVFSTPSDREANWLFRTHLVDDIALRRVVERLSVFALAPVLFVAAVLLLFAAPAMITARLLCLLAAFSAVLLRLRFRHWCKLPFTCAYTGRLELWQIVVAAILVPPLTAFTAELLLRASRTWLTWLSIMAIGALVFRWLPEGSSSIPPDAIVFEETEEPDVQQLGI